MLNYKFMYRGEEVSVKDFFVTQIIGSLVIASIMAFAFGVINWFVPCLHVAKGIFIGYFIVCGVTEYLAFMSILEEMNSKEVGA